MDEITKAEFLKQFGNDFTGTDETGYMHEGYSLTLSTLTTLSERAVSSVDELTKYLENLDEDELVEFHNRTMAHIFGDGDNYQGSYEEKSGSGDYDWYLDLGEFKLTDDPQYPVRYEGVRFYHG